MCNIVLINEWVSVIVQCALCIGAHFLCAYLLVHNSSDVCDEVQVRCDFRVTVGIS